MVQSSLVAKDRNVAVDCDVEATTVVVGDQRKLMQVLLNLVRHYTCSVFTTFSSRDSYRMHVNLPPQMARFMCCASGTSTPTQQTSSHFKSPLRTMAWV